MEEICYFSTVRRISNFTGSNRIFGGWETDRKTQNMEIHSNSIAFLRVRDLAQVGGAVVRRLQRRDPQPTGNNACRAGKRYFR